MGYALPTNTTYVSSSWQDHKDRKPPSSEPGTDYGSAYGSPLYAVGTGTVVDLKTSNSAATGRFITIDLDDGRRTRSLHLSEIWVSVGQRVSRGEQIGKTGASANGSDWGVGAHVHQTLWANQSYSFCSTCTIDFEKYAGDEPLAGNQRQVGAAPANQRPEPKTSSPASAQLDPGTVGTFNGWIRGESVEGNDTWFRGQFSGLYSWSGGFTDTGTHDLVDLNPSTIKPTERQAGADGANGRREPRTDAEKAGFVEPNAVANFNGWITGEPVEGNATWFRRDDSLFYWSGGFVDTGTHDLTNLNAPSEQKRTTSTNVNYRDVPYLAGKLIGTEGSGVEIAVSAWAEAEPVGGNNVWFQRRSDANWMWSGGFTSTSTTGVAQVAPPPPPSPYDPDNPRDLPEYPPVYPRALKGLEAPLGFNADGTPSSRAWKGNDPVVPIIDRFIIHHTATTTDQLDWFSYENSRSVCPTFYLRTDGAVFELIRPDYKPAATGPQWNYRSIAVETQNLTGAPEWTVASVQVEELAQIAAWLYEYDGKQINGVPVSFKLDRTHVISHQEALPGQTECPGPFLQGLMDSIVQRAWEIWEERHPTTPPDNGHLKPEDYPELFILKTELSKAFGE